MNNVTLQGSPNCRMTQVKVGDAISPSIWEDEWIPTSPN